MSNSNFEPIIPINLLDINRVKIINSKFVYNDDTLTNFDLKLFCENFNMSIYENSKSKSKSKSISIESVYLLSVREELEKLIKVYKKEFNKEEFNKEEINKEVIPVVRTSKRVKVNFTKNTKVNLIPTIISGKQKILVRDINNFMLNISEYYKNSNLMTNIIIRPIILKNFDYVWFEIIFADVFHKSTPNTGCIYKRIYSNSNSNSNSNLNSINI